MTRHEAVTEEVRERASLYHLGLLEPSESAEFERHLAECQVCQAETRAFRETAAQLVFALPPSKPAPGIREQMLRQAITPHVLIRAAEGVWKPTPFEGIEIRQLFVDPATGNVTSMVRLQPGSKYPAHRHAGFEHCYVLEGDLVFSDHTLHAGDYEVNGPETDHSFVTTHGGCLLFLTNNQADQVFERVQ
jgi:quercetin dioxygenase-like cupin family protein